MRKVQSRWPWLIVVLVVAAAGWWLLRPQQPVPATAEGLPAPSAAPPAAPTAPAAAPAIAHPLDLADAADAAIPALAESDAAAWEALAGVVGDTSVLDVLLREHLVQRLVVMIDNLPEPRITTRALAMRPLPGAFAVEGDGTPVRIAPANAQRYEPYVRAFVQADPQRLAALYRRFYPLFQQAYAEVAGPDAYFNDRLVAVIDHLLQAPDPAPPLQVTEDVHGKFRFVDPALESLSVGQKALVRLTPDQRDRVRQQLRAIRQAIARG
jgi:hypothetical protein